MSCFRPDEWQAAASERLQALLTVAQLRRLVGDFEKTLSADRRAESGADRPSGQAELADALLIAHDVDLLADKAVRNALVRAAVASGQRQIDNPKAWYPGRQAARQLVAELGLPAALRPLSIRACVEAETRRDGRPVVER